MSISVGDVIRVQVCGFAPYGIFVTYKEYSGLIHISEISPKFVHNIHKYASLNEIVCVKVLDIDESKKRLKVSLKALYNDDNCYVGNYLEEGRGFLPLKENLPIWVKETLTSYSKNNN